MRIGKASMRQYRTVLIAQIRRQFFRQTNNIDAGNSESIAKEICAVWRKKCKQLRDQGVSRELCGIALPCGAFGQPSVPLSLSRRAHLLTTDKIGGVLPAADVRSARRRR